MGGGYLAFRLLFLRTEKPQAYPPVRGELFDERARSVSQP